VNQTVFQVCTFVTWKFDANWLEPVFDNRTCRITNKTPVKKCLIKWKQKSKHQELKLRWA